MHEASLAVDARVPDADSSEWIDALSGGGREKERAVESLHALLLRASRFEIARRRAELRGAEELEDLATQAADDARMAIMGKLHTFRGDSRFTTWAYKFALLEAAVKVRRRAWQGREVALDEAAWGQLPDPTQTPAGESETAELIGAVRDAIAEVLTSHQRSVLVAIALDGVPIDVLAERLTTTRGALYKTVHDARKKLRAHLAAEGLAVDLPSKEATA
jgi:RNA polymerase sigma-70 factor, ECF subfamily